MENGDVGKIMGCLAGGVELFLGPAGDDGGSCTSHEK